MTVQEAISARHSVRTYLTKPVEPAIVNALRAEIRACNAEGGLHIQLVMNEPMAFRGFFAHYGKFRGVCNYIVLAGKRAKDLDERAGWFGERLVLLAQTLGLNTCWVGLTFSKAVARRSYVLAPDERLVCVIAFGYGAEQGEAHESRPMREVYRADRALPEWFSRGLKAALLAPTAMNQQRFRFTPCRTTPFGRRAGAAATAMWTSASSNTIFSSARAARASAGRSEPPFPHTGVLRIRERKSGRKKSLCRRKPIPQRCCRSLSSCSFTWGWDLSLSMCSRSRWAFIPSLL